MKWNARHVSTLWRIIDAFSSHLNRSRCRKKITFARACVCVSFATDLEAKPNIKCASHTMPKIASFIVFAKKNIHIYTNTSLGYVWFFLR